MSDIGMPKQWTEEQWSRVQQVVHDQAMKTRIAGRFLPLYGPIPPGVSTVPRQLVTEKPGTAAASDSLEIIEPRTLDLITVAMNVELTTTQQSEPDLSSALTLFARAANIIARTEDGIIFQGKDPKIHPRCTVTPQPQPVHGLLIAPQNSNKLELFPEKPPDEIPGEELVKFIARGVTVLDGEGYLGPYALVLGEKLFLVAQTPNQGGGLVLPSDRIRPLIEGQLLRSGSIPDNMGVLISLAANPVEIVVASDIHVRFLQVSDQGRYLYRVSQRFALRIKEPTAIVTLRAGEYPKKTAKDYDFELSKAQAHLASYQAEAAQTLVDMEAYKRQAAKSDSDANKLNIEKQEAEQVLAQNPESEDAKRRFTQAEKAYEIAQALADADRQAAAAAKTLAEKANEVADAAQTLTKAAKAAKDIKAPDTQTP